MIIPHRLLGDVCGDYASTNYNNNETSTSHLCPQFGVADSRRWLELETKNTSWIAGRWLGNQNLDQLCFAVIDTPGIGAPVEERDDCRNFMGVAEMARKISPIDAFVLVIKGTKTQIGPELLKQLGFFQELFGEKLWDYTTFAVSFWGHKERDRFFREKLTEAKMAQQLNLQLRRHFPGIRPLPAFFIDPVFDPDPEWDWVDQREIEMFEQETDKLWKFMTNGKRFECDGRCNSPTFLTGTPTLEGENIVSQKIGGTLSVKWTIWFGDCDQEGVRSYTVLKDDQIIFVFVEAQNVPYVPKPSYLDIVDSCSNRKEGTLECDNIKSKYKTVTLTFTVFTTDHVGKYKMHNIKGVSKEVELVEMVDGKAGQWSDWTPCTKSCISEDGSFGTKERRRTAVEPVNGGKPFTGGLVETANCGSDSPVPR